MVEVRRSNGRARSRQFTFLTDDGFSTVGPLTVIAATVVACVLLVLVGSAFAEFPFTAERLLLWPMM